MDEWRQSFWAYIISALYQVSLFTESYTGENGFIGLIALSFGGLSILLGEYVAFAAWSANVLFFIVLFGSQKIKTKLKISGITIMLGLLALSITGLPMTYSNTNSPVEIGTGFYFWIGSFILLFIKNLYGLTQNKELKNQP